MTHFELLEQIAVRHKIKRGSLISLCLHFYCVGFQNQNKEFKKGLESFLFKEIVNEEHLSKFEESIIEAYNLRK